MDTYLQDIRYAFRVLRKNAGFTAVAALTLAIGIGANTAIFSVVNAVLLRPLPFHDPSSLCLVTELMAGFPPLGPSYLNLQDFQSQNQSFEDIAAARNATITLTGLGDPERLAVQQASANLFPLLGVNAYRGHTFLLDEDRAGAPLVTLISYGFWQSHLGGAPDALGRKIILDNQPYTVVGVLPPGFQFIQPADVYIPIDVWLKRLPNDRNWHPGIIAIGRLKPGVPIERARAEMSEMGKRLEKTYPVTNTGVGVDVYRLQDQMVQNIRPALLVLLGAVALVLLIACANIANLLLARATARRREVALRTAVGAGRGRIVRQLLTESLLLALGGGLLGIAIAYAGIPPLVRLAGASIPNVGPVDVDVRVLVFACAIVAAAGILFGLGPAISTTRIDLRSALTDGGRGSSAGFGQRRLRSVLVITEVALAMMLLIGAGLFMRSFARLSNVEPGFQPGHLLIADIPVAPRAYPQSATRMNYFDRVLDHVRTIPGVTSAGASVFLPVSGNGSKIHFNIQGRPPKSPRDFVSIGYRPVSPHYLDTLKVPLLHGRYFAETDTERAPFAAVLNRSAARQFFPAGDALGKRVQLGGLPEDSEPWMEIVGIVGDMKQSLAGDSQAEMYVPYRQADSMLPVYFLSVVVRTAQDPRTVATSLRASIREVDANQAVVKIRTMEDNISTSVNEPRFRATLLGIFAAAALLLSIIGLYGVMMYAVTQRASEIGIRMTLGAQQPEILRMVIGQGLALAGAGVAIGIGGALLLTRILARFLFGIGATDPSTYVGVAGVLLLVALAACYIPARRAIRLDPVIALRCE